MPPKILSFDDFTAEVKGLGVDVSRETSDRLQIYAELLTKWQARINLVAADSLKDIWRRHFLDSAQLQPLLPPGLAAITDFGSGAGFPGLVLALLSDRPVHLVESDRRKCAFLWEAARLTGVLDRISVHDARIEALKPWPAPIVTARALAPLEQLLRWVGPFLTPDSQCLFLKGACVEEELTAARRSWTMRLERTRSRSDPSGCILKIYDVKSIS